MFSVLVPAMSHPMSGTRSLPSKNRKQAIRFLPEFITFLRARKRLSCSVTSKTCPGKRSQILCNCRSKPLKVCWCVPRKTYEFTYEPITPNVINLINQIDMPTPTPDDFDQLLTGLRNQPRPLPRRDLMPGILSKRSPDRKP